MDIFNDYAMQDIDTEKSLRAINYLFVLQFGICLISLRELRSADLKDMNILVRVMMSGLPRCDPDFQATAEDVAVDMWVDRAEYVDDKSFNLYLTQAEENVLWNPAEKGRKPRRLECPQQRLTLRYDTLCEPPYIPAGYLTILGSKLFAMAFPDEKTAVGLSDYTDEKVMMSLMDNLCEVIDKIVERMQDEDTGCPVS